MSKPLPDDIIEATRLTQAGRLGEATALLQKLLGGVRPCHSTSDERSKSSPRKASPPVIDVVAQDVMPDDAGVDDASAEQPLRDGPCLSPAMSGVFQRFKSLKHAHALHRTLKRVPPLPSEVGPSSGDFVAKSFSCEAGSRAYKLYIPSGHQGEPRPLVIMLHGCTQSPDDFAAGTRMNFAAEEHTCFVAYPEQSATANSSKCWNWFNSDHQKRDQGEPSLIAGIARQVMTEHNIDDCRIYIAGLSAGGAAAAIVAEAYPDVFAALGVHSGLACGVARDLPSAFVAMQGRHSSGSVSNGGKQIPTIVFHGDRDTTVHPKNGVEVVARAAAGGDFQHDVNHGSVPAGRTYTRSVHRDANGNEIVEEWTIHGAGHAWSGGSSAGSYTDPLGPDATKEMLRFFLKHRRPE
ncbi:MAG: PHB depolymerase family esterase [Hyphomicrobium sp.]|jgi:poly(hydroxyalkanoate) depolymerase family esterase